MTSQRLLPPTYILSPSLAHFYRIQNLDGWMPIKLSIVCHSAQKCDIWWYPKTLSSDFLSLQWYRPRSLTNLDQDTASIWSGGGGGGNRLTGSKPSAVTDPAKNATNRSQSLGEINHGFSWDNVRPSRSGQSVDNYKDVALWQTTWTYHTMIEF